MARDQGALSRRSFCSTFAGVLVAPDIVFAHSSKAVRRIGVLLTGMRRGTSMPFPGRGSPYSSLGHTGQLKSNSWQTTHCISRRARLPKQEQCRVELASKWSNVDAKCQKLSGTSLDACLRGADRGQ